MPFAYDTIAPAASLAVAVVAAFILILQIRFSATWTESRGWGWASVISCSAILYAVGIFLEYAAPAGRINRFGGLLEWTAILFLVHALYGFVFSRLEIPSGRYHGIAGGIHGLVLILLWSTPLLVSRSFTGHHFLTREAPFVEAGLGPLGPAFMLYAFAAAINALRFWISREKGRSKGSRAPMWGVLVWVVLGAHDGAVALGVPSAQYVMEYGFLGFSFTLFYTMFSDYTRLSQALECSNVALRAEAETRGRAEEALRRSEREYRELIENINDVVYSMDTEGKLTYISPVVEAVMGYSPSEILGRPFTRFIFEEDLRSVQRHFEEALSGRMEPLEFRLLSRSGAYRWVRSSGRPILDGGRVIGLRGMYTDIHVRRQAEENLREHSEHLKELVEERTQALEQTQDALIRREKLAVLGQLAGGVGHELRNPLGAIKNAAYYLRMAFKGPERETREALDILNEEVARSESIIHRLFDMADPKKPKLRAGVSLNETIRAELTRLDIPRSIQVTVETDEELPYVTCDPEQMEGVIGNLLRNAVQAMREGGRLKVWTGRLMDGRVEIGVSDTGEGVPEENLGRIFEPLFTSKAKGIGLGLALCRTSVEAHGGTLDVESREGEGATFMVRIPVTQ